MSGLSFIHSPLTLQKCGTQKVPEDFQQGNLIEKPYAFLSLTKSVNKEEKLLKD